MSLAHRLGLTAPVQLVKSGAVTGTDNLLAACLFAPLTFDQGRFRRLPARILRWVPLAHCLDLPLGTGLINGTACDVGGARPFYVRVRTGGGLHRRGALDQMGVFPHPAPYTSDELDAQVNWTWWYEYRSLDPRFQRVLVASNAIFYAYYAPSSQMASLILRGDFETTLQALGRQSAYVNPDTGVSHLNLGNERLTSEIPLLARVLFDASQLARNRANCIGVNHAISMRRGEPRCIKAEPPFEGETTLGVLGYTRRVGNENVLVVLQILECSHPFPFHKLEALLDQPGNSTGKPSARPGNGAVRVDQWDNELEELDGEGSRPGVEHMPITATVRPGIRFNAINKENYQIDRRYVNRQPNGTAKVPVTTDPRNASQRKHGSGDPNARQTHTTTQSPHTSSQTEQESDKPSKGMTPSEAFRLTGDQLHTCEMHGAVVTPIAFTDQKLRYGPWLLNVVRQEGEHRRKSWMRIQQGEKPRGILIARVSQSHRNAYVIEVLRNGDEAFATLVVHNKDGSAISEGLLRSVFEQIDESQSLPRSASIKGDNDFGVTRVKHWAGKGDHRSLSKVLSELLAAPPDP